MPTTALDISELCVSVARETLETIANDDTGENDPARLAAAALARLDHPIQLVMDAREATAKSADPGAREVATSAPPTAAALDLSELTLAVAREGLETIADGSDEPDPQDVASGTLERMDHPVQLRTVERRRGGAAAAVAVAEVAAARRAIGRDAGPSIAAEVAAARRAAGDDTGPAA